jgi:DNA-binding GntR family transcriptional regulator
MITNANKLSLEPLIQRWEACEGDVTKYQRLAEAFYACVRSGDYAPGDHLPNETEICAALPVGLSTVQKALAELVEDGMVVRRRKLGSFIAGSSHQVPEVHVYRFRDRMTGELQMPFTRVLDIQTVRTAEYGTLLSGFDSERVTRIDRLVWVTGSQPAYSSFFIPCENALDLPDSPDILHGASYHRLLWEKFGIRIVSVRHSVRADLLSGQACSRLDLAAPHVGMIWNAFEYDREDQIQIVQHFELPQGHRPMELVEGKPRA